MKLSSKSAWSIFPRREGSTKASENLHTRKRNFRGQKAIVIVSFWYGKYRIPAAVRGHIAKYYLTDGRRNPDSQGYKAGAALRSIFGTAGCAWRSTAILRLPRCAGRQCRRGSGSCAKTISSIRKRARISIWKRSLSMSRCSSQRRARFGPARSPAICVYAPVLRTRSKHRIR